MYAVAGAVFFMLLAFLAMQMRAGRDPMAPSVQVEQPRKRVLVKRIERRVIITSVRPAAAAAAPVAAGGGVPVRTSAPVAPAAAPAAAAPAPAPAAPAPAPVVTRSS